MTMDYKALKLLTDYLRSTTEQPFECYVVHKSNVFLAWQWIFSCTLGPVYYSVSYDGHHNKWYIYEYTQKAVQVIEGDE